MFLRISRGFTNINNCLLKYRYIKRVTQKSKIYEFEVDLFGYLYEIVFKYSILAK